MRMVLDVIAAEAHGRRKAVGEIGEQRVELVQQVIFENAIVDRIVDDHEIRVIGEGADAIGKQQRQRPIGEAETPQKGGDRELQEEERDRDLEGQYVRAEELAHLRIFGEDRIASLDVRTVGARAAERESHASAAPGYFASRRFS